MKRLVGPNLPAASILLGIALFTILWGMPKRKNKEKLSPIPRYRPGRRQPITVGTQSAPAIAQAPVEPDLSRISPGLRHLALPINSLVFHPTNPRKHDEKNLAAIRGSLVQSGQYRPAIISRRTGENVVIVGNGMLAAALAEGWTHLAAEPMDMTEDQENELAIRDNQTAALAEWDQQIMADIMARLKASPLKLDARIETMLEDLRKETGSNGQLTIDGEIELLKLDDEGNAETEFLAPFPWFGGKSRIARVVWRALGDVPNYIEPFFGSGAVLLRRPLPFDGTEVVNDADGLVCNFWRAIKAEPQKVAEWADWPTVENDLNARHFWLVERKDSLQSKLEGDPDYFDAKIAGWWVWSMACWIGSEFCSGKGPWQVQEIDGVRQLVHLSNAGRGVQRQLVHLGNAGRGVQRKRVHLGDAGRGKPGKGECGLLAWMEALAERFRRVRVCCGDWTRVCGGDSGDALAHFFAGGDLCGIFLDPPYSDAAERDPSLYRVESGSVAVAVREWALRHGEDERLRIVLAGYEGEHKMPASWRCLGWKAAGGYSNLGKSHSGRENAYRERLWLSPHCLPIQSCNP